MGIGRVFLHWFSRSPLPCLKCKVQCKAKKRRKKVSARFCRFGKMTYEVHSRTLFLSCFRNIAFLCNGDIQCRTLSYYQSEKLKKNLTVKWEPTIDVQKMIMIAFFININKNKLLNKNTLI